MIDTGRVGPDHARRQARLQVLDGTPTHHMTQKDAEGGYRLFIATPKTPAPPEGWPAIYLLDGNAAFDFLTAEHLAQVPGLLVIGVGYATDLQFARERRVLDFTPSDDRGIRPDPVHPDRMCGGGARFLDLLLGPLREIAEEGIPVTRRMLWGHSFGGLFALYALLTRPEGFARYAAISPSIWWDEPLIRRIAQHAPAMEVPLLVAMGDREKRSGSGGPPPDGPPAATMRFLDELRDHPGLHPEVHVLEGLKHIETLPASLPLALRFAI